MLALARVLPRGLVVPFGGWLGRAYARLRMPRTGLARGQIAASFPDWERRRVDALVIDTFGQFGRSLVETLRLLGGDEEDPRRWVEYEGLEHLTAAQRASRRGGVILLTGHFGSWELLAAATAKSGYPISIVHRPNRNPFLERLILRWRARRGLDVIQRGAAARSVMQALRKGRVVVMPLDQDTPRKEGVFVPFFGRPASTRDAPARLATRMHVPVVPAFVYRRENGLRHRGVILPALELDTSGDDETVRRNVAAMTRTIEDAIRAAPDQWIWVHRRWRTQPKTRR